MNNKTQEHLDILLADGWVVFKDVLSHADKALAKHVPTDTPCFLNERDGVIQVIIRLYSHGKHSSFEIELVATTKTGHALKLDLWAYDELEEGLAQIPAMIKTWEFFNNQFNQ